MWGALVTNLGCHNFSTTFKCTNAHVTLLSNGVKFVPTPPTMSRLAVEREVAKFINSTRWRAYWKHDDGGIFIDTNNSAAVSAREQMPSLYRSTGAIADPLSPDSEVNLLTEAFLKRFTAQMDTLAHDRLCARTSPDVAKPPPRHNKHLQRVNLTREQRCALAELRIATRFTVNADTGALVPPRIVICNADKNLGLTIVDYEWFRKECTSQLANQQYYAKISALSASQRVFAAYLSLRRLCFAGHAVHQLANVAPEPKTLSNAQKFLTSVPPTHSQHRIPSFHVIPKVHKLPEKFPGRPITPAHRFTLAPACEFITCALHPLCSLVPEILRDSMQLILELEDVAAHRPLQPLQAWQEIYLVTGDVESLYTNIPRLRCLDLLRTLPIPSVVIDLLALVFEFCIIQFDTEHYQQIDGFPMGISPAPDVANLFMWLLLRQLGEPPAARLLYRRLIDDLFIVWQGTRASLDGYLASINQLHPNIRVTWSVSRTSATFLDLDIHTSGRFYEDGRFGLRVHQKQLNRYLFIPQLSFHTNTQHRAWIKAELLRFMRNTSSATDYVRIRKLFIGRLFSRGFGVKFVRDACNIPFAAHKNRDCFLSQQQIRQDTAYESALLLLDRYHSKPAPYSLHTLWCQWHVQLHQSAIDSGTVPRTPWPGIEQLLLSQDLMLSIADTTIDHLFGLFKRDAPPPAFFLPLTRESAGLRWRDITLTPTLPSEFSCQPAVRKCNACVTRTYTVL